MAKLLKNIGWSSFDGVYTQVVNLATLAILMKLLPPRLFGILAMLNIFINISYILVNAGFSQALIQRRDLSKSYYTTVFWLNIGLGVLLYAILFLFTPLIAQFFEEESLTIYFPIALIPILISSTYLVQQTILEKNLRFKAKAIINISSTTLGAICSIYLAFQGFGIWALIWPTILTAATTTLLYWIYIDWRPSFHFSLGEAKELFSFGAYLTGSQLFGSVTRKFDDLLIGKFLSSSDLGVYNVAYKILMFPLTFIKAKVSSVLFPSFATYDDLTELYNAHLRASQVTLMVISPVFMLIFLLNKELIQLLLDPEWYALSKITTIFALTSVFISIGYPVQVLYALGQSKKVFNITLVTRVIFFALILVSVLLFKDLVIISIFISIGLIQHNVITNIFGIRALKHDVGQYFRDTIVHTICPYLIPALITFGLCTLLGPSLSGLHPSLFILTKCVIFSIFMAINPRVRNHIKQLFLIARQYAPK